MVGWSIVVTLFFAKKSLTKTDRCAGALSCWGNQLLVLHFSGRFLLIASLRRQRMSIYIFFITGSNSCNLYQQIPVNYTSEFREIFEATTYIGCSELFTKHWNSVWALKMWNILWKLYQTAYQIMQWFVFVWNTKLPTEY